MSELRQFCVEPSIYLQTQETPDESPLVFLSYQWGRQPQVIALYKRLTSIGYTVWMDIHQMGGGDSLYDKIDRGLRGCNVVVSCVTPKYSLSANCRREVSLADALKKPIIPLLLEEMKWPPDGPMSMVFTELLFINMYRDPQIQVSWTGPKVDELLQKLEGYVPSIKPAGGNASASKQGKKEPPKGQGQKVQPKNENKPKDNGTTANKANVKNEGTTTNKANGKNGGTTANKANVKNEGTTTNKANGKNEGTSTNKANVKNEGTTTNKANKKNEGATTNKANDKKEGAGETTAKEEAKPVERGPNKWSEEPKAKPSATQKPADPKQPEEGAKKSKSCAIL